MTTRSGCDIQLTKHKIQKTMLTPHNPTPAPIIILTPSPQYTHARCPSHHHHHHTPCVCVCARAQVNVEKNIASVKEVFRITRDSELREAEGKYLPKK